MNFKASKPDARILILQIVAACILSFYFKSQLGGNPKFCVTAKSGANREKFIMGGRREKRLPPC